MGRPKTNAVKPVAKKIVKPVAPKNEQVGASTEKTQEEPKPVYFLGSLKVLKFEKDVEVNGRKYIKVWCEDGTTYLLNEHDLKQQLKTVG